MQPNRSESIKRQRIMHVLVVCCALSGLAVLADSAAHGRGSQGVRQVTLSAEDPRPVAKLIEILEEKYGWVITYEDPRYVHESDLVDVALKVRRDLDRYKPGEVPPVFVPKGGLLKFTYDVAPNTNLPTEPVAVVQRLLGAQAALGNGGRFRVVSRGKVMHVIPVSVKNSKGELTTQVPVLDTIISLTAEERTVLQKVRSICEAVSQATNIPIKFGIVPEGSFSRERDRRGAKNQKARDVLLDIFQNMEFGKKLSWQLFYSPGWNKYYLNIHEVSKRDG